VHAHTVSRLSSKVTLSAGYAYTDLNSDVSGYRAYGAAFDPDLAQRLPAANTFDNLSGGSVLQQHVGNLNLMANLAEKLVLVPSLRIESRDTEGSASYLSPAAPFSARPRSRKRRGLLDISEGLTSATPVSPTGSLRKGYGCKGAAISGDRAQPRHRRPGADRQTDDDRFVRSAPPARAGTPGAS
jgi:hypothetical protein